MRKIYRSLLCYCLVIALMVSLCASFVFAANESALQNVVLKVISLNDLQKQNFVSEVLDELDTNPGDSIIESKYVPKAKSILNLGISDADLRRALIEYANYPVTYKSSVKSLISMFSLPSGTYNVSSFENIAKKINLEVTNNENNMDGFKFFMTFISELNAFKDDIYITDLSSDGYKIDINFSGHSAFEAVFNSLTNWIESLDAKNINNLFDFINYTENVINFGSNSEIYYFKSFVQQNFGQRLYKGTLPNPNSTGGSGGVSSYTPIPATATPAATPAPTATPDVTSVPTITPTPVIVVEPDATPVPGVLPGNDGLFEAVPFVEVEADDILTIESNEDGTSIVQINEDLLDEKIEEMEELSDGLGDNIQKVLIIDLSQEDSQSYQTLFSRDALKKLSDADVGMKIKTSYGVIYIPTEVLKNISASDIVFEINKIDENTQEQILDNTNAQLGTEMTVASPIIEFKIKKQGNKNTSITKFNSDIQIELSVDDDLDVDYSRLGLYYLDERANKWVYISGSVNGQNGGIAAPLDHLTKFAIIEYNKKFDDVDDSAWFKEYVEVIAAKHITTGVSHNMFAPDNKITRAEFATFLVRALNLKLVEYTGKFKDVEKDTWYASFVETAAFNGIVNGDQFGNFNPTQNISREQMAKMIVNCVQSLSNKTEQELLNDANPDFSDMEDISDWAINSVKIAYKLEIINGINNSMQPKENSTRAQAAAVIYRLLSLMGSL